MDSSQPIGVFDSGVGGLSVVRQILKQLPDESIVYFGDTARVPYGPRPSAEIIAFGDQILSFLLRFDVKVVVAACNTSTSVSLPVLRRKYHLPLLGVVEPGVRAALQVTGNRRIGVLATAATVNSGSYTRGFQAYDPGVTVFAQACPQFVPLVESGKIDGPEVRAATRQYLQPLQEAGVDTIVLGCTHYPFLAPVIRELAGEAVEVVDPAEETVKELAALLALQTDAAGGDGRGRARRSGREPACGRGPGAVACGRREPASAGAAAQGLTEHRFFASGATASFYSSGRQFLGDFPFQVEQVSLNESNCECGAGGQ
ncbi:MAG: glutamate racemase [Thermacetogeniaceae bacterium]